MENVNQIEQVSTKPKLTPISINLGESIKVWWKNLPKFISIFLWGLLFSIIPLFVVFLFFSLGYLFGAIGNIAFTIAGVIIAIIGCALAIYFAIRFYVVNFLLVKENFKGDVLELFKKTKVLFWPYFWLSILSAILIFLWCLLLIIPGIIFSIFYSLAVYALLFEGEKGMNAIRRSKKLIKGYFWPVLGRLFVIGLLVWLFMMIISIPVLNMEETSAFAIVWNIIIQAVSFIIGPIVILFSYSIFKDLVKIKK